MFSLFLFQLCRLTGAASPESANIFTRCHENNSNNDAFIVISKAISALVWALWQLSIPLASLMSDSIVESLEDRCCRLEGLLGSGYSKSSDVSVQLNRLYLQLHDLYFQGQTYSQSLLQLLDVFVVENTESASTPDDVRIFASCFEEIYSLYIKFDQLNDQYMEFCQTRENSLDQIPFKDAKIQTRCVKELPGLVNNCNTMILRSMAILNRFFDWNIEVNEFFQLQKKKLIHLQRTFDRR